MNYNIDYLKNTFKNDIDLIIKNVDINNSKSIYLIFLESLNDQNKINDYILKKICSIKNINNLINIIPGGKVKKINNIKDSINYLYNGYALILFKAFIYAIETKTELTRSIGTNETETSIKGPKNAFVENIQVNLGLIKKRIKTKHLCVKNFNIGKVSQTAVNILYIDNIAKKKNVTYVINHIKKINKDIINDSASLIRYLEKKSVFPTIINTERPDRCSEALCQGKIVILTDNSPAGLIVPGFLIDFINPFEDEYNKAVNINITKFFRIICFICSIIVPAFYIAIINYNEETIPTNLIINFAKQRSIIPFPAVIECILMLSLCEILRESDLRFPSKYGSAISILGALILGDAAVSAGLVSPIMIIITAFTYTSSLLFSDPEIGNAIRHYRFLFILLTFIFGLYGLYIGLIFLIINLCNNDLINIPYTFPIAPFDKDYFKNNFLIMKNKFRSKYLTKNKRKEK